MNTFVYDRFSCGECADKESLGFDFTMAFQPIIDCHKKTIFGYEALARGLNNESAYSVISQVKDENRYLFDQLCRVKAISLAAQLRLSSMLSINISPNAIYKPERCIRTTLAAAQANGMALDKIMFEFTEVERFENIDFVRNIIEYYAETGFTTAMDDFGAGYSGLGLLANFRPHIVKIDMGIVRNVDRDESRQHIIRHCINLFADLGITPLAEGIETEAEMSVLRELGVDLMQGYYFAKPGFEQLPSVDFDLI